MNSNKHFDTNGREYHSYETAIFQEYAPKKLNFRVGYNEASKLYCVLAFENDPTKVKTLACFPDRASADEKRGEFELNQSYEKKELSTMNEEQTMEAVDDYLFGSLQQQQQASPTATQFFHAYAAENKKSFTEAVHEVSSKRREVLRAQTARSYERRSVTLEQRSAAGTELDRLAKSRMLVEKIGYQAALKVELMANPNLARDYAS